MEDWFKAGKVASEARAYAKTLIKPNVSVLEVSKKVEDFIKKKKGLEGFPSPQISINEIAAHYYAYQNDKTIIKKGDVVSIDIGTHVNGWVGDNATTVEVGSNKYKKLIESVHKARDNAIKEIKPRVQLCKIGEIIEETISSYGFKPIRNLSGHNLAPYVIHGGITIPNFNNKDKRKLEEGDLIAIEPFATDEGVGMVKEGKPSSIFRMNSARTPRDMFQRKIIKHIIDNFKTLPFATRQLAREFPISRLQIALSMLKRQGIIHEYTHLVEKSNSIVTQAEDTVVVKENKAEVTTKH